MRVLLFLLGVIAAVAAFAVWATFGLVAGLLLFLIAAVVVSAAGIVEAVNRVEAAVDRAGAEVAAQRPAKEPRYTAPTKPCPKCGRETYGTKSCGWCGLSPAGTIP